MNLKKPKKGKLIYSLRKAPKRKVDGESEEETDVYSAEEDVPGVASSSTQKPTRKKGKRKGSSRGDDEWDDTWVRDVELDGEQAGTRRSSRHNTVSSGSNPVAIA